MKNTRNTCPNCGQQLNSGELFCRSCGARQGIPVPGRKKGKGAIVAAGMAAAFLVGGAAAFSFGSRLGEEAPEVQEETGADSAGLGSTGLGGTGLDSTGLGSAGLGSNDSGDTDADSAGEDADVLEAFNSTFSAAAVEEVLGYVDEAEKMMADVYSRVESMIDEMAYTGTGQFRDIANMVEQMVADLTEIREQAVAVSEVDTIFAGARDEYFDMIQDSQNSFLETFDFLTGFFDFGMYLWNRPERGEYDSIDDYYYELDIWYNSVREAYFAIDSCPACMESKWAQYGRNLDLVEEVLDKMEMAYYYTDYLRYYSAQNMLERFDIVGNIRLDEFDDCMAGEYEHIFEQMDAASSLAEELHLYAGLDEAARKGYEFEAICTGKICLDYDAIDAIYPSLYNTYDAFVVIKTGTISGTRKITVEAEIPGFTQRYIDTFTLDSAYQEIYIRPPALTELNVASAKEAQISLTIYEEDGTRLEAKTFPVTIKSKYDVEWYTDDYGVATQDNILCFLTPEAKAIGTLKRQAIDEIASMTGGEMESFVGYQNVGYDHYVGTYLQVAGIMRAMNKIGIRYNMDSFSISGSNQHVLYPEDVLDQKSGLCVETALVMASALQSAGMHAFLIFPPGHTQVAVEIWDGSSGDDTGVGEYFLIETTALDDNSNYQELFVNDANRLLREDYWLNGPIYYLDQWEWFDYIYDNDTYIIDCDDSRILGLTQFVN